MDDRIYLKFKILKILKLKYSAKAGFTLVELAVVVMIMGVLFLFSLSLISSLFVQSGNDRESNKIVQAITFCKQKAVISQLPVFLDFNLEENYYRAYTINKSNGELTQQDVISKHNYGEDTIVGITDVEGSMHSDVESYVIQFLPNGISQSVMIFFGDNEKITTTVEINKYSGEVVNHNGKIEQMQSQLSDDEKEEDIEYSK